MDADQPVISITDFVHALDSYFDPKAGMQARDRFALGLLRESGAIAFMFDDTATLAAALSGCLGVSGDVDRRWMDGSTISDDNVGLLEVLVVDEKHRCAEVLRELLRGCEDDEQMAVAFSAVAVYLSVAPFVERSAEAAVSYELFVPGGSSD